MMHVGSCYWFTGFFKYDVSQGLASQQSVQVTFEVLSLENVSISNCIFPSNCMLERYDFYFNVKLECNMLSNAIVSLGKNVP